MKLLYKSLLILFLIPMVAIASPHKFKGKYTKEKTLNKEYTVNSNAGLRVVNSYGNIDVVSWNENRIVIEVVIKTNGDNEEKVQKKLNEINVEFSGNGSLVTAKTIFGHNKSGSWSWWKKSSKNTNVSMEINYIIKVPVTNTVDLSNNYGSISLNRLLGTAKIHCDHGQIIIGELLGENNSLNFDYTNNATIEYMKNGRIDADYSNFTLVKAERLELNADYTNSEILEVDDLNYNSDYGKLIVKKVNNLVGRGDYIPNRIGTVTGSLNLNTNYGSITIERLTSTVKDVIINSDYTGVKIGFDSNLSFDFYIQLSYASLKGEDDLSIMKTDKRGRRKTYEGYHNQQSSGTKININSTYGGVSFTKL